MERGAFLARFPTLELPPEPPRAAASDGNRDPACFCSALEESGGEALRAGEAEWALKVAELAGTWGVRTAVANAEPLLEPAIEGLRTAGVEVAIAGDPEFERRAEEAELGLTSVSWALASTGTLVLIASPAAPRSTSLLPAAHLAVVPADAIIADLAELAAELSTLDALPSAVTMVSGPSRTADIEQTLVVGVHGPGRLGAVVIEKAPVRSRTPASWRFRQAEG